MLLSASVGAGHVRAAQAIEKELRRQSPQASLEHIDVLDYTNRLFRAVYSSGYIHVAVHIPALFGYLYDLQDTPWKMETARGLLMRTNTRPFLKMLQRQQPDLVICSHFLPTELVSWLKQHGRLRARHAIAVTDVDPHAWWFCRHYDHYFVAMEESRQYMARMGIDPDRVTVSGIPIDPVFGQPGDKRTLREKHGLDPDTTTLLVSTGGWGKGPIIEIVRELNRLTHPCQVVVICGRNEQLRARLQQLAGQCQRPGFALIPIGFTHEMHEYMDAADLMIGKTGGLTVFESLAKGLPSVIIQPIPGQEERNADHLLEEGTAIRCNNIPTLAFKIDQLLNQPGRLAAMSDNARRLGHPDSADTIARTVLTL